SEDDRCHDRVADAATVISRQIVSQIVHTPRSRGGCFVMPNQITGCADCKKMAKVVLKRAAKGGSMKNLHILGAVLTLAIAIPLGAAGEKKKDVGVPSVDRGPEHRVLETLVGSWDAKVTFFYPDP